MILGLVIGLGLGALIGALGMAAMAAGSDADDLCRPWQDSDSRVVRGIHGERWRVR